MRKLVFLLAVLGLGFSVVLTDAPQAAEDEGLESTDASGTVIEDNLLDDPLQYLLEPYGYREFPPGYREFPLGYRKYPIGHQAEPRHVRDAIPNTLELPRGFNENPPNFIELEEHPQVSKGEGLRIETKTAEETRLSDNFRKKPPGYKVMTKEADDEEDFDEDEYEEEGETESGEASE